MPTYKALRDRFNDDVRQLENDLREQILSAIEKLIAHWIEFDSKIVTLSKTPSLELTTTRNGTFYLTVATLDGQGFTLITAHQGRTRTTRHQDLDRSIADDFIQAYNLIEE